MNDQVREDFEAWWLDGVYPLRRMDRYEDAGVSEEMAQEIWQASRESMSSAYTAMDMTTAAADGFSDGAASVVVDLEPDDLINETGDYLYIEFVRARIIAAGGRVKE